MRFLKQSKDQCWQPSIALKAFSSVPAGLQIFAQFVFDQVMDRSGHQQQTKLCSSTKKLQKDFLQLSGRLRDFSALTKYSFEGHH